MKKKSAKKAADAFTSKHDDILGFLEALGEADITDAHLSWAYDYAIIRLYREFEELILNCLTAAINSDTEQLSQTTGISFPKHLTDEVCEYIITSDGYFDFRGRDGLIRQLKRFLPDDHYLVGIIKQKKYKDALEQLSALRNFAAHDSQQAKRRALDAIAQERLSSAGAWLKRQERFDRLAAQLNAIAKAINEEAPY